MSGLHAVVLYLASLGFNLLIYSFWLRVLFRIYKVNPINPLSQLVYTVTNPLVTPLQNLTGLKSAAHDPIDWITMTVLVVVELIKIIFIAAIMYGIFLPIHYLVLYVLADLVLQPCHLFFYLIIIEVVISWVNPGLQHPAIAAIRKLNAPLLNLGRKIIPDVSGFDFSPILIIVFLTVISLFITHSLPGNIL